MRSPTQKIISAATRVLWGALALWNFSAAAVPMIFRQPTNQVVLPGNDATFSVGATGASPLTYQWRRENVIIPQATNADLVIRNAHASDTGKYNVIVTDTNSSILSQPAFLYLVVPAEIVSQPQSQTVPLGGTATFSVMVTGVPPARFQWLFNASPIPGATNQSLVVSNVSTAAAGNYTVQVWNTPEIRMSDPAMLTVIDPPVIVTPPQNLSVPAGSSATFNVSVTGAQPMSYQWMFNGATLAGATNAGLTLNSVAAQNQGSYSVAASNPYGMAYSSAATLDVTTPYLPATDTFSNSVVLAGVTYFSGAGSNFGATIEPFEPKHDGRRTSNSVWISWLAPTNGLVTVNTLGSDFDTVLAIYTGASVDALTVVESDDDSGPNHTSQLKFNAVAGTIYRLAVSGYLQAQGNFNLELNMLSTTEHVPVFLSHPRSYSVGFGDDAYMNFYYTSADAAMIQWEFMGLAVLNSTTTNHAISTVDESRVGAYRVKLTTTSGITYSRYADLQINSRGLTNVLAHDKLGGAGDAGLFISTNGGTPTAGVAGGGKHSSNTGGSGSRGYTSTQIFSTIGSGADPGEPVHCGIGGGHSEWFAYQAEASGTLRIDTDGSSFDTVLAVYIGPGDSYATLTNIACDNNSGSNGLTSKVMFTATQGEIYWIAVDGVGSSVGTVHLNINLGNPVTLTAQPQSQTVPSPTNVSFTIVAAGMTNYSYQWRFAGTNLAGATGATFTRTNVSPALAGSYDVVVQNSLNAVTSSVAVLTIYSGTINITNQPQSRTVTAGTNTTFSVGASGAAPVRYQWRFNGTDISTATNAALTLVNVQSASAGTYAVNVTDANGSLLSSNATLTVLAAPVITLQPVSHTAATGAVVTLTAAASGAPAPSYQWLFNGVAVSGATSTTLTLNNFQSTNQGLYSMRASNSVGTAVSAGAELLLNAPLRFTNNAWNNGAFSARLIGVAGSNYLVQCSTNATDWNNVATNSSATGLWNFTDANTNSGCRMFRAVAAP